MTLKKIKPKVEYAIYKMYQDPEYWDGPYRTLKQAIAEYRRVYAPRVTEPEDFRVYKIVTTALRVR